MQPMPESAGDPESSSLMLEATGGPAEGAADSAEKRTPVTAPTASRGTPGSPFTGGSQAPLPPGLLPQPRPRARWEDYLSPSTTGIHQPTPVLDHVLRLEAPRSYGAPGPTTEAAPAPLPVHEEEHGPTFDVPELPVWTPPVARTSRLKLAAIVLFSIVWGVLAAMPQPKPVRDPEAVSVTSVPAEKYARYSRAAIGGLPIIWMVQVDRTLVAVVTPAWQKMAPEARVQLLRKLDEIGEGPREVLVMNKQSDLLAEIYERQYHIYR